MKPSWLAVVGCVCALAALGHAASVGLTTPDTLVVARAEDEESTPLPEGVSTESPPSKTEEAPTTEEPNPPIKLTEMAVSSEVSLRYAHTAVVTRVRNPAKRAQEATFRVLLPETAFISGFTMILDGKAYKAYVKEKEEAKQIYSDAVSQGIGAAHIAAKARDSNHFTVSVNVEPNTVAVFNLTYEELLVRRNGVYNHAVNLHPGAVVPKLTVTVHVRESQRITALRVPEVRTGNEIDATEDDAQNSKAVIERGHDDREATITFAPDLNEQRRLMEIYADKSKESQSAPHSHGWYGPAEAPPPPEGVLGQFVVQYDVDRPKDGEILVNDGYFVHFFAPADLPPLNKHVVFVLDTSGSMMDRKIVQLREAMQTILGELNKGDYFSIVEFASSVKVYDLKEADEPPRQTPSNYFWHDERPVALVPPAPATADNIARAKTIVSRLSANGGTNIAGALNIAVDLIQKGIGWTAAAAPAPAAPDAPVAPTAPTPAAPADSNDAPHAEPLEEPGTSSATTVKSVEATSPAAADKLEGNRLEPIIIFLTDGDPTVGETDPVRINNRLSEKNYGPSKAAIFSLAFGEDADRKFLRKLSLRNDGFMRHIYEAADAALQLRAFYRQVSSPLLADVTFQYPAQQIKEGSLTRNKFRTLYAGAETVVAGRVDDAATELAPAVIGVCGVDDSFIRKKYEIFPKVPTRRPAGQYLPLERMWAYLTIKQLLDERDASDAPPNKNATKEDTPEKKALDIALKYEFVTPLTSLVVVKPNATKAVDAESVDKQDGGPMAFSGGIALSAPGGPAPAYAASFVGAPGVPGPPQFSYSHVQPLIVGGAGGFPGAPLLDSPAEYEDTRYQAEDFEDDGAVGLAMRSGYTISRPMYRTNAFAFDDDDVSLDNVDAMLAPNPVGDSFLTTPLILLPTAPPTTSPPPPSPAGPPPPPPAAAPRPFEPLHLETYPWVRELLKPGADVIAWNLDSPKDNQTYVELELTTDASAPKEATDAECAHALDGAGGVCVYVTRCQAAHNISAAEYKNTYCRVADKFAGVCCPRGQVYVPLLPEP